MTKRVSREVWQRYGALFTDKAKSDDPVIPSTLPYQGKIYGPFSYDLSEDVLERLRKWLSLRQEITVYYFMTEYVKGEENQFFEINIADLTVNTLSTLNKSFECVLVATDFSWHLFIDHEGFLYVAGPEDLFTMLQEFGESSEPANPDKSR